VIPKKLRLKNFTGIRSGLGRDEIIIDFETLAYGAQLVALTGPNGTGKSTILDNMHPFRIMPSRAGSYSPGSFSFYDNVYGAEAVKELEFSHGNLDYLAILVFKMGTKTKKTECYLQYRDDLGVDWFPYRTPDGVISDGKTETYDRCIEHILGTPEMFFTSVFAAQNRRALSSYTNGEIKGLLSELLGLENIRELGDKARDVAHSLRVHLTGMRGELVRIDTLEAERATVEATLENEQTSLGLSMQARFTARGRAMAANKRLSDLRAERAATADVDARRATLTARRGAAENRRDGTLQQLNADIVDDRHRSSKQAESLRDEAGRMESTVRQHQTVIDSNEQLLSQKDDIEQAARDIATLEAEDVENLKDLDKKRTAAAKYRQLVGERDKVFEQLKASAQSGQSISTACDELKGRAGLIDNVPCKGMELQARCQLLHEANTAKGNIPATEQKLTEARAQHERLQTRGKELQSALALMGDADAELHAAEQERNRIVYRTRVVATKAALADSLTNAEQVIAHSRSQITGLQASIAAKLDQATNTEAECNDRLAKLNARRSIAETECRNELSVIDAELASLPPPLDGHDLETAEAALKHDEDILAQIEIDYERLLKGVTTSKERVRAITADLTNASALKAKAGTIENEIAHWTTLQKAFGNDGIIALSIDDAGPTLSGLANDLLTSCYGPRFTVKLKTQEETAAGDMKETFGIVVFDGERDDEKNVRDMSGGERIWINECITRAIALYQSQASGQNYGTLFADESDGALDPERKQMFISMKRKVLELGGYEREFFISHTEALWEAADAVINVSQFRQER
jgi:exonuclease SbcC